MLNTHAIEHVPPMSHATPFITWRMAGNDWSRSEQACCTVESHTVCLAVEATSLWSWLEQPEWCAGGFADSSIRMHSLGSSAQQPAGPGPSSACLRGHTGAVYGVDFTPDQQLLLSASADGTVRLWSTELAANLAAYRCQLGIHWAWLLASQHRALSCDWLHTLTLEHWAAGHLGPAERRASLVEAFRPHQAVTAEAAPHQHQFCPHSSACYVYGNARRGHSFPVWDVAASPVGQYFASASADRVAHIWVTERVLPLRILAGQPPMDELASARLSSQALHSYILSCLQPHLASAEGQCKTGSSSSATIGFIEMHSWTRTHAEGSTCWVACLVAGCALTTTGEQVTTRMWMWCDGTPMGTMWRLAPAIGLCVCGTFERDSPDASLLDISPL